MLCLLVGHASIALHTAGHATNDIGECAMCVSYGDLSKAVSASPMVALSPSTPTYLPVPARNVNGLSTRIPTRQRGPPAPI
jgi:hypothetical protein